LWELRLVGLGGLVTNQVLSRGKPWVPRELKTFQCVGAGQAWANELDLGRGRTVRSIITGKSKWAIRVEGPGKGRPILGVAGKGRQGGWVGVGVQQGPRLWVGGWCPMGAEVTGWSLDSSTAPDASAVTEGALSCGVVGVVRGGEGWGGQLGGGGSREVQKIGLGVAGRGTGEDWHGQGHGLSWLVGSQLECFFPGPH